MCLFSSLTAIWGHVVMLPYRLKPGERGSPIISLDTIIEGRGHHRGWGHSQMPSKDNSKNKQVNVWGMTEVILTSWRFCLWGNCNRCAHPVHPGHHWQKEYRSSKRHGASVHRPDHHGHRSVHGSKLWLSHQPRTRPRPTVLHSCGRLGHGSIQVILLVTGWKCNSNLYELYTN